MNSYVLEPLASLKALLHTAKYPHSTVIGLLVGTSAGDGEKGHVMISDVIPLVHHWVHLSPMLEAGVSQADIYARSTGLKILGTYIAHPRKDDDSFDFISQRINDSIKTDSSIALVIDNRKLLSTDQSPFIPYIPTKSNEWEILDKSKFESNVPSNWTSNQSLSLLSKIGDFDDHLEDIGIDWLINPDIKLKQI